MSDEYDGGNETGNVHMFPDRRTEARRQRDVSDEYLRMVLQGMERRIQTLEERERGSFGVLSTWRGAIGLAVFCSTAGAGGLYAVLRLTGKL